MPPTMAPAQPRIPAGQARGSLQGSSIAALFACILRFSRLREQAYLLLKPEYLDRAEERHLALLWDLVVDLHPLHPGREPIPLASLVAKVEALTSPLAKSGAPLSGEQAVKLVGER